MHTPYRWIVLSNTTLGVFMAALDSSIVLISLPAIFRGIHLDPLRPENVGYLLWMLMGYLVVRAPLHDRRHARRGPELRAVDDAARQLLVPRVRRAAAPQRHRDGLVRRAEHGRDHEQRARRQARRRVRHARDLPEQRDGAVGRRLLLADDPRVVGDAAALDGHRAAAERGVGR